MSKTSWTTRSHEAKATIQPLPSFSAGNTFAMLSTFSKP